MWSKIRKFLSPKAALIAGFAAGTVYLVFMFALLPVAVGVDGALFIRYSGALILGPDALVEHSTMVFIVGLVVHYLISILLAFVIAIVVFRWNMAVGIIGGALLGLAFYAINLYLLTLIVSWFFAINSPLLLAAHVLFGAVAGGVYEALDRYDQPIFQEDAP